MREENVSSKPMPMIVYIIILKYNFKLYNCITINSFNCDVLIFF